MKNLSYALAALVVLGGCSVSEAAKKRGVPVAQIMKCQSRVCFLALRDMQVLTSNGKPGEPMYETYKVLLEQGSAGRAVLHGVLDVATLGIWEVAGTPIEGSIDKDEFVIITANYDPDGRLMAAKIGDRPLPAMIGANKAELLKASNAETAAAQEATKAVLKPADSAK